MEGNLYIFILNHCFICDTLYIYNKKKVRKKYRNSPKCCDGDTTLMFFYVCIIHFRSNKYFYENIFETFSYTC